MGLSKRQQKRLTRRRQKAQRKTNKRRNKNKRGGRKSRVKRQRKRGGMMGDAIPSKSQALNAPVFDPGQHNAERLISSFDLPISPINVREYPQRRSQRRSLAQSFKKKRTKKTNRLIPTYNVPNIHESPIPYYPVLTLFRLLKMSIDHDILQLQHQTSHGSAIRFKLNSLVNSYIDQQEDIPPFQKKIRDFLMEFLKRALIKDAETHDATVRHHETLEVMNLIGKLIKFKINNIEESVLGSMNYNQLLDIFTITDYDLDSFTTISNELVKNQNKYVTRSGKIIEITNIQAFLHYVGLRFVECLKCTNAVESVEKLVSLVPPAVLHATDVNQLTTYFIYTVEDVTKEFHDIMGSLESMMMKALGFILDPISKMKGIISAVGHVVATRVNKAEDELQRQLQQQITENDYLTIIESTIRMMSGSVVPTIPHDESRIQQLSILEENYKKMPPDVKHAVSFILDRILSNEHVIQDELQKIRDKYPGRSVSQQDRVRPTLYSPRYTPGQSADPVLMTNTYRKKNSGRNHLSEHIRTPTHPFAVSYPQSQLSERAQALKSNNNYFTFGSK